MDGSAARKGRLGELLRLSGPVIAERLGIMAMGLTDTIVVGRHSSTELGYHALGWGPTSVVLTVGVGLLVGVQVMTARLIGEGRPRDTGRVLRRGMLYALLVGIVAVIGVELLGPLLLGVIGLTPDLAAGAAAAMRVFALSLPAYLVSCAIVFWLEALHKPGVGMVTIWVANLVNLALNLWLVPGHSPFGVSGAVASAWATFGARHFMLFVQIGFLLWWTGSREHGLFERRPDDGTGGEQRRVGYGAGLSYFAEAGAFAAMGLIAGLLGALPAAAWAVVINVAALIFMVPLGLAAATAVLVGNSVGERHPAGVAQAGKLGFVMTSAILGVVGLILWLAAGPIAAAYSRDPALIALVAPALALSALFVATDGLQVVGANALRARGDIWVPTAIHLISYIAVMVPLGWLLSHPLGLGLAGLVWAIVVASLMSGGLLVGRFALLARRPLA